MTKRLLLEGPEIQELLSQVRDDYGDDARIVAADRIRSGGVAGFFAKQRYELTIEIDDDPPGPGTKVKKGESEGSRNPFLGQRNAIEGGPGGGVSIDSVDGLIAMADAGDRGSTGPVPVAYANRPYAERQGAEPQGVERQGVERQGAGQQSAERLGTGRPYDEQPPAGRMQAYGPVAGRQPAAYQQAPVEEGADGAPFTPAAGFDQVLAALRRDLAEERIPQQGAQPSLPPGARQGTRPTTEPAPAPAEPVWTPPAPARLPLAPAEPSGPAVEPGSLESGSLESGSLESGSLEPGSVEPGPIRPSPVGPSPVGPEPVGPEPVGPGPATRGRPAARQPGQGRPARDSADPVEYRIRSGLLALGVPADVAGMAMGRDPFAAIVQAFSTVPPAPWPPNRPGDVLVIAGPPQIGLDAAARVARAEQLNPGDTLLAASTTAGTGVHAARRITGPADALRRARRMHRSDTSHLVVVATSVTEEENGDWVRSICDSLGASAVWVVVDATRKTADTRRHLESLGPVHGLVVHGVRATADPGSVLELQVPVVYLDGRRASPAVWAGLLCERLEGATA